MATAKSRHSTGPINRSALGNMTASEAKLAPQPMSPFVHASNVFMNSRALSNRVLSLAERLLAHYPPAEDAAVPSPSCILSILDRDACDADEMIAKANQALDAIESALP